MSSPPTKIDLVAKSPDNLSQDATLPAGDDLKRLRQLVLEKCDGTLTEQAASELSLLLANSQQARQEYWQLMTLHSELGWQLEGREPADTVSAQLAEALATPRSQPDSNSSSARLNSGGSNSAKWWAAIAASLLIGAFTGNWFLQQSETTPLAGAQSGAGAVAADDSGADSAAKDSPANEVQVIGNITPLVTQCNWSFGRPGGNNAPALRKGDTLWLDEGAVELRLTNDVSAQLQAPAIMQVVSVDRVRMIRGGVKVEVAKGAEGFSVETDTAEVIDLGTVFSVSVDSGNTDLVVFDGEVDLKVASLGSKQATEPAQAAKRFRAGQAVQVAHDGTLSRIVNVRSSRLRGPENDRANQPLIASVRDDNVREDFYSFYEIVPAGMREDAKAFVDRPHEWNGIRSSGMPSYLAGGDYVKTFNNDKVTGTLSMEVRLTGPSELYVLLDKRVAPPEWLRESFENTGDEIGIDEVHFRPDDPLRFDESELRIGAGRGINRKHSIWKQVVAQGGVVPLGGNGELIDEVPEGVMSKANMFGIVAVPVVIDP